MATKRSDNYVYENVGTEDIRTKLKKINNFFNDHGNISVEEKNSTEDDERLKAFRNLLDQHKKAPQRSVEDYMQEKGMVKDFKPKEPYKLKWADREEPSNGRGNK